LPSRAEPQILSIGGLRSSTVGSGRNEESDSSDAIWPEFDQRPSKYPGPIGAFTQGLKKFARFVGPGFLIAVAYIDPGNYATDVAAGAETKYALLFIIMLSNIFAVFLQSLSIKLGSVTGLNLAENCKAHFPKWVTILLYLFAESAIIATDIAEVSAELPQD
jgi:metal iron transporter